VRIDPLHSLALNNLADLLCRSGRSEEALELLDQAKSSDAPTQALIKATREEIGRGCEPLPESVHDAMQTPQ
jgi:pentatricopeptide repeat protein